MKEAYRLIELRIEKLIIKVKGNLSSLERNKIINIIKYTITFIFTYNLLITTKCSFLHFELACL